MREKIYVVAVIGKDVVRLSEGSVRRPRAKKEAAKLAPLYPSAFVTCMTAAEHARFVR